MRWLNGNLTSMRHWMAIGINSTIYIFRHNFFSLIERENVDKIEKKRRLVVRGNRRLCYLAYVLWFNNYKVQLSFPTGWVIIIRTTM